VKPWQPSLLLALACLAPQPAWALEPLEVFLEAGREANFDNREARISAARQVEETWVAWSRLLPVFDARLVYTRNQYEGRIRIPNGDGSFNERVVSAQDQTDAFLELSLPLIDLGKWAQIAAAEDGEVAAHARAEATGLEVQKAIARAYYQVVAADALLEASDRNVKSALENLRYVEQRQAAGFANEVDVKRAAAEVERNRQTEADSRYLLETSRRLLGTLSGTSPGTGVAPLVVELEASAPLSEWLGEGLEVHPTVKAARAEADAADARTTAATALLLPSIAASAQERFTNAAGFVESPYYTVSATARWQLDLGAIPARSSVALEAEAARVRQERALRAAADTIFSDWHQVEAQRQKGKAARAELEASQMAARLVKQRYEAGTANWLDVILAERDLFGAEVSKVRSDADLAYARVALALSSGRGLGEGGSKP
jgi:outer membrane protein